MASTLAAQLQELARQRPALPATLRKGGKPSLLYDFQRAADVDLPTIHDIASQGERGSAATGSRLLSGLSAVDGTMSARNFHDRTLVGSAYNCSLLAMHRNFA